MQLTADVARTYVLLRDMQTRLELAQRVGALNAPKLELVRQRFARGASSQIDVERVEGDVQASRAQVLHLRAEVDIQLNALSVLTGQAARRARRQAGESRSSADAAGGPLCG